MQQCIFNARKNSLTSEVSNFGFRCVAHFCVLSLAAKVCFFSENTLSRADAITNHALGKALVLKNNSAVDVSRAMIESGRQKEPFYVYEMDQAYERIQHFREMMPRIKIFYAMKANDSDMMIKLAASLGIGFDCASPGEIHKILKINVSPLKIIFAIPTKTPEWMSYARQCGIKLTTFDTLCELKKMTQYWPEANLVIRIRVDGDSIYKLGEKFGCDFETQAIPLLEEAAALGLKVVGVAYHVGSACFSIDSYVLGLQRAKALFEHEAKAGRKMNIVDIGGGFLSDHIDRINEASIVINKTLEELFPDPNIQVFAEPGRYLCDNSYTLFCSINNVRREPKGDAVVNMLYLNDGVYGTLKFNEPWHTVKRYEKSRDLKSKNLEPTILWGPSCDSRDRVMKNVNLMLPRCTPSDWLIFFNQGAYTFTLQTKFSSLEGPLTRTVISEKLWNQIKDSKAFKPDDFIRQDISVPLPSSLPPLIFKICN